MENKSWIDNLKEELGNTFDMESKKINCGRCRYFGYNNGKSMTNMGDSYCILRKCKVNKLSICSKFEPENDDVDKMMNKTIQFDVLIKSKYSDTYIPCEGYLLSKVCNPNGLGYKVKVTSVLGSDTPAALKKELLSKSYVYVKKEEIEEYAKIVGDKNE